MTGLYQSQRAMRHMRRAAMQRGEITAELYQGYWADIGTPQRLADADILFRSKS